MKPIDRLVQAGAPLPQQGNKLVQQELARLTTDQTGPATSAQFDGASIDGAPHDVAQHPVLQSRAGMRQLSGCDSAADCMAQFLELAEKQEAIAVLNEEDCISLISATISRGNFKLAKVWHWTAQFSEVDPPNYLSLHPLHQNPHPCSLHIDVSWSIANNPNRAECACRMFIRQWAGRMLAHPAH